MPDHCTDCQGASLHPGKPHSTVEELKAELDELFESMRAGILEYEERCALQHVDEGKTPAQRAVDALERPERFRGEHQVARAYLANYAPNAGIFKRKSV